MSDIYWNGSGKSEKASADDDKNVIEVTGNHIYFYNGVDLSSALTLNKTMQEQAVKISNSAKTIGIERPVLHLHINSSGGMVVAGTSIMDTINRIKNDVDIYTYVEGIAASAATFISVVGTKRFITENSFMLIHQISSALWGTYAEFEDKIKNLDSLMKMLKSVYKKYTSVPEDKIKEVLSHDLYWNSEKCLELGLVDEIL